MGLDGSERQLQVLRDGAMGHAAVNRHLENLLLLGLEGAHDGRNALRFGVWDGATPHGNSIKRWTMRASFGEAENRWRFLDLFFCQFRVSQS